MYNPKLDLIADNTVMESWLLNLIEKIKNYFGQKKKPKSIASRY